MLKKELIRLLNKNFIQINKLIIGILVLFV